MCNDAWCTWGGHQRRLQMLVTPTPTKLQRMVLYGSLVVQHAFSAFHECAHLLYTAAGANTHLVFTPIQSIHPVCMCVYDCKHDTNTCAYVSACICLSMCLSVCNFLCEHISPIYWCTWMCDKLGCCCSTDSILLGHNLLNLM